MTDYEKEFQKSENVCGEPFEEIDSFFQDVIISKVSVLDLGCGQGRDALMVARLGHKVTGVDISKTGVSQMMEQAEVEDLDVKGIVSDIVTYEPTETFDIVLLDRVLHMLDTDEVRGSILRKACRNTQVNSYILIADTPSNMKFIKEFFKDQENWVPVLNRGNFLFIKNVGQSAISNR